MLPESNGDGQFVRAVRESSSSCRSGTMACVSMVSMGKCRRAVPRPQAPIFSATVSELGAFSNARGKLLIERRGMSAPFRPKGLRSRAFAVAPSCKISCSLRSEVGSAEISIGWRLLGRCSGCATPPGNERGKSRRPRERQSRSR